MLTSSQEKFGVLETRINPETMRGGPKERFKLANEMKGRYLNLLRDFLDRGSRIAHLTQEITSTTKSAEKVSIHSAAV